MIGSLILPHIPPNIFQVFYFEYVENNNQVVGQVFEYRQAYSFVSGTNFIPNLVPFAQTFRIRDNIYSLFELSLDFDTDQYSILWHINFPILCYKMPSVKISTFQDKLKFKNLYDKIFDKKIPENLNGYLFAKTLAFYYSFCDEKDIEGPLYYCELFPLENL